MKLDLRTATYEEFETFVFDHYPEDEVDDKWYWKSDVELQMEPRRAIDYLTRVLSGGSTLLEKYTPRQIAEGLNYLIGGTASELLDQFWNPEVPWPDRQRCIQAIPKIYTDVLERDPDGVGGCAYMLWDWVAYGYQCGNYDPEKDAEAARVQDAMFKALTPMLRSEHRETQVGALHGLGHLRHRDSARAIREFLDSDRPVDSDVREYAARVLEDHFL
jgi:hypothetical protein